MLKKSTILFILGLLCLPISIFAQSKIIYVNTAATGTNDGSSWQNAYKDLQDALQIAKKPDAIWIAKGTYFPTKTNDRTISYDMKNGVSIYGGFEGNETSAAKRDFEKNKTILSGNIGTKDSTDNCYNVVKIIGSNIEIYIDGINITGGNANISTSTTFSDSQGGGVYINGNSNTTINFNNCRILSNTSVSFGGGVMISSTNGISFPDVTFSKCIFENNRSIIGGAFSATGINNSNKTLFSNCDFNKNYARIAAAVDLDDAGLKTSIIIFKCNFTENCITNYSDGGGAGIRLSQGNSGTEMLIDSTNFMGNKANEEGGGLAIYSNIGAVADVQIRNSKFVNNKAIAGQQIVVSQLSNGVQTTKLPKIHIINCIFDDNVNSDGYQLSADGIMVKVENSTFFSANSNFMRFANVIDNTQINIFNNLFRTTNDNKFIYFYAFKQMNVTLSNNIFLQKKIIIESSSNTDSMKMNINNNIFISKDLDSMKTIKLPIGSIVVLKNNQFSTIPNFVDTANKNFHLLPCSPAINAGNNAYATGNTSDLEGKPRISHQKIDIGPYEFQDFKINTYTTKPTFCASKQGSFLPIFKGNCSNSPTITWENAQKQTGSGGEKLSGGVYTFFVKDTNGCADTLKNITIEDKGVISADFNIFNTSGTNAKNGSITVKNVNNGKAPFKYVWSNGDTTKTIQSLKAGDYSLTITDANGCVFSTILTVKAASATSDIFVQNISIMPNPASEKITFNYDVSQFEKELFVTFYDLQGKVVLAKRKIKNKEEIDVSSLAKGLYFWQITDNQFFTKINKIVIQ